MKNANVADAQCLGARVGKLQPPGQIPSMLSWIVSFEHSHPHLFITTYGSLMLQMKVKSLLEKSSTPASVCRSGLSLHHQPPHPTRRPPYLAIWTSTGSIWTGLSLWTMIQTPCHPPKEPASHLLCSRFSLHSQEPFLVLADGFWSPRVLSSQTGHFTFESVSFAQIPDLFWICHIFLVMCPMGNKITPALCSTLQCHLHRSLFLIFNKCQTLFKKTSFLVATDHMTCEI